MTDEEYAILFYEDYQGNHNGPDTPRKIDFKRRTVEEKKAKEEEKRRKKRGEAKRKKMEEEGSQK